MSRIGREKPGRGQNKRCDRSTRARDAPPSRRSPGRLRFWDAWDLVPPRSRVAISIRRRGATWRAQLQRRSNSDKYEGTSNRIKSHRQLRRVAARADSNFLARSITREHAPNSDRGNQRFPGSPLFFESVITAVDGPLPVRESTNKNPENRESFWPRIRSRAISQGRRLTPRLSRGPRGRIIHADPTLPTIH